MVQTYILPSAHNIVLLIFFCLSTSVLPAQFDVTEKYWVHYRDKHGVSFDPYTYFDPEAITRRHRENLSLYDSSDFPLNEAYVKVLKNMSTSYHAESRWFNASICWLTMHQRKSIEALPFVTSVTPVASLDLGLCALQQKPYDEALLKAQTEILGSSQFNQEGINGKGVTIAIFDAGFKGMVHDPHFRHLIDNKQIKATYNFVLERDYVFDYHTHGTMVLSCIAGKKENDAMGLGTGVQLLLARTEQTRSESKIEEDNWIRSLEWADQKGADIVNSSLGYTDQLYLRKDMTGRSHKMAQAANMAFSKGILVVNSAGNEGMNWWEIIAGPADADSILTVGGIDPWSGIHHPQSSYGPNLSGQLKPNVSAYFSAVVSVNGELRTAEGTSFSAPLVAGFAACVWQLHPDWQVRQIYQAIQESGHLYPYYDYAHGYGMPQASALFNKKATPSKQFETIYNSWEDHYCIHLCESMPSEAQYSGEARKETPNYVYYSSCDSIGKILTYHVIQPEEFNGAIIEKNNCDDCLIRIHYHGQTMETTKRQIRQTTAHYENQE
jgi:serine protease AprX